MAEQRAEFERRHAAVAAQLRELRVSEESSRAALAALRVAAVREEAERRAERLRLEEERKAAREKPP
eukprot:102902-Prymnesium_polylepis.1